MRLGALQYESIIAIVRFFKERQIFVALGRVHESSLSQNWCM